MTSDISFILKIIPKYDPSLHESTPSTGGLPNRLLSPITENSAELHPLSLPTNKTSSDPSPTIVLTNDNSTTNERHSILVQRFHQYTINFDTIQIYLDRLQQHFKALTMIIEHLRIDPNIHHIIEPIETRLLQMRAKRDQIDHLLHQSSMRTLMQQISPLVLKSKIHIIYNELFSTIQLSLNQKTTLIDHLKNEYRYEKYQIKEYSSKLRQRHDLLIQLTNQIEQWLVQHERRRINKQVNPISIINEHNRQCLEFTNLSNEYEQLQNENYLLTLKAKENIDQFSRFQQFNQYDKSD